MEKNEFTYSSTDGKSRVHAIEWVPMAAPVGVLQIVHGMQEYIGRYDRFARFMAENGFVVTGCDLLGHGLTAADKDDLGYFADEDGNECLIGDIRKLHLLARSKYPGIPYFILGYSMGSFLTMQYIEMYGKDVSGAVLMSTGKQSVSGLKFAMGVCRTLAKTRGWRHKSKLLYGISMGKYNDRIENPRTRVDWLTRDESVVDAYVNDPLDNFKLTVNGFYNMFRSIELCQSDVNIRRIPKKLPVLLTSGEEDPVGSYGKGVEAARWQLIKADMEDVTIKLYPGYRHEILNELGYDKVEADILGWIMEKVEK